ncbi:MAG: VOC family protein [Mariprofundaceae bacterium]|nr:VOC family protein [Mariprofundaceae bacterium]
MFSPHHVAITASGLERSVSFYEKLGFCEVLRWQAEDGSLTIVQMRLNTLLLEIFCYASSKEGGVKERTLESDLRTIGTKHFGLRVDDIEAARKQLIEAGLADVSVTVTKGRTGIEYLFLRDPDGLFVEIVQDDRDFIGRC